MFTEKIQMNNRSVRKLLAFGSCAIAGMSCAAADEIIGKDQFVCTAWHAVTCTTEGQCNPTEAWRLNMPDFLEVDLDAAELQTPEGSDEPRFTAIESISRNEGRIFLNGWQQARGFSWVINEESGEGTLAIVSDTTVVTLFTACAASDRLTVD
jgi:hypothetical protein